jgi:chemotaxis signal transduction protein
MHDPQHSLTPEPPPGEQELAGSTTAGQALDRMRTLLARPLSTREIRTNTELVAAPGETAAARMRSIVVFAVGAEHFALEADATHRVVPASVVRRVPHRSNAVFAGIANVAGELTPVGRIGAALGVPAGASQSHFVVIGAVRARWAFAADRVDGVRRVDAARCIDPPATIRHAADGCTRYLAPVSFDDGDERLVAVLDAARVATLLARSLA